MPDVETWPTSLPQCPILNAFEEQPQLNAVSFQPDVGPLKLRRRASAKAWACTAEFRMNDAELADFNTFYETTLEDGTLPFYWDHPVEKVSYRWMFKSNEQPKITRYARNASRVHLSLLRWPLTTEESVFNPIDLFTGVVNGGFYLASDSSNTLAQFTDLSGLGNHLTQSTAASRFDALTTGVNGRRCYRSRLFTTAFFNFPSVSVNQRSHSWWAVVRSRSMAIGGSRCFVSFDSGLTDLMTEFTSVVNACILRTWGSGSNQRNDAIGGDSSVSLLILSASASDIKIHYNDRAQWTATAYAVATRTGGFAFKRQDGFAVAGEVYEFGLIDRPLTTDEITSLRGRFTDLYCPVTRTKQLVIVGDSLSEGQDATSAMLSWTSLVDEELASEGWVNQSSATSGTYLS